MTKIEYSTIKEKRKQEVAKLIEVDLRDLMDKKFTDAKFLTLKGFFKKKASDYQLDGISLFDLSKEEITQIYSEVVNKLKITLHETIKNPIEINEILKDLNLQYNDEISFEILKEDNSNSFELVGNFLVGYIIRTNFNNTYITFVNKENKKIIMKQELNFKLLKNGIIVNKDFSNKWFDKKITKLFTI